jgi:hypothetical protein
MGMGRKCGLTGGVWFVVVDGKKMMSETGGAALYPC